MPPSRASVPDIPVYALYGEADGSRLPAGIHAETISARSVALDWRIAAHRHSHLYQALMILGGHAVVAAEGRRVALPAPALVWTPPLVVHGYDFAPGTVGIVVSVPAALLRAGLQLAPAVLHRLGAFGTLAGEAGEAGWDEAEFLCRTLLRDYGEFAPGREAGLSARAALLALWAARRLGMRADPSRPADPPLVAVVRRFLAEVEERYAQARPLPDYARSAGVSLSHLGRACRSVTGHSPIRLIHDRRFVEAKRLLAYTALPVGGIAHRLGFADAAYFSRFFQRCAGIGPLAFRRLADAAGPDENGGS